MKKFRISALLLAVLLMAISMTAFAEDFKGADGWKVTYDGKDIKANYKNGDITDALSEVQPGDSITFTITLVNSAAGETNWWMNNAVIKNFEEADANGGAYSYVLTYNGTVIYSSDAVGGDEGGGGKEGLQEATGSLEEDFFLDTLKKGETGEVVLKVSLDGETQGNAYQDTIADLEMTFGVEPNVGDDITKHEERIIRRTVRTGDATAMLPYVIAALVSGMILLVLAIVRVRKSANRS